MKGKSMAKKPATKKATDKILTPEQVKKLGDRLATSTSNVYRIVESMFGIEVDDEIFRQLEEHCGLFKCEECNVWQPTGDRCADLAHDKGCGICEECVAEMNDSAED